MAPVAANNEEIATLVFAASGTDPVPRFDFFPEPDGLTEPPNMQPFGENMDIFGHGGNPDHPDLPDIPNGTDITLEWPVWVCMEVGHGRNGKIWVHYLRHFRRQDRRP